MQKLKIYSDRDYSSRDIPSHCAMLAPFWGEGDSHIWFDGFGLLDKYIKSGRNYFELVDRIEDAHLAVLPSTYHRYLMDGSESRAHRFAEIAAAAGKPVVVFHERDWDFRFPHGNAILFSPTFEGRSPGRNEFSVPGWVPDHAGDDQLSVRPKRDKPVVGFCGWVRRPSLSGRVKQFLRMHIPPFNTKRSGSASATLKFASQYRYLRKEIIQILNDSPGIETNFILRDEFFAGTRQVASGREKWDKEIRDDSVRTYVDNMRGSDYVICPRGIGNYSFRFYEALSFGRLPVFINTRCVLPYDFEIDWPREMPWVEIEDVKNIGTALVAYHDALTPEAFEAQQLRCRQLWEEWLSPNGFFKNFFRHLDHISGPSVTK